MREYVTIQGDTWDGIAFKLYGDESQFVQIMNCNTVHINTVIFSAGVKLHVPEAQPQTATNLPPWKRGG